MAEARIVRYQVAPERAEENERLIRAVFADLAATDPGTIRYAAFRLGDGVTFVHVAVLEGEENPLNTSSAFQTFQSGLRDRCTVPPDPATATVVGAYGLPVD